MPIESEHNHSSSDSRYLDTLVFEPELRKGFLNFFVSHTRVVILLIILLSGWGIYAYNVLPRESNPEVKIAMAIVSAVFPGASPSDVEELVTKKIETEVSSLKGVSKVTSTSSNSVSVTSIEFEASEDIDDAVRRVRDAVDNVSPDLPDEVDAPTVSEVSFDDQPILTIALTGPYDGFTLREYAETIKDELEKIADVREVKLSGGDEVELSIAYDPAKLALYGLSAEDANRAVQAANIAVPGGNFDGQEFVYPIRSDGRFFDAPALGSIPIIGAESGAIVYLRDIATVEERAIKHTSLSRLSIGGSIPEQSVTIDIVKKTGGSIINIADTSKQTITDLLETFPSGMRTDITVDFSEQISTDFTQLGHDFLITVTLVVITLILLVGIKEALIAGLTIPLVFFATFGTMMLTGTSLNFLSLFSLLLALGLLVDDAIVVVSATKQYLRTGKFTPEEAVLLVLRDFKVVLLTTTLATTFAFMPLLLSSGIMGEFIKSIPITVSVTLISSLIIAIVINHPLAAALERIRFTRGTFWALAISALATGLISIMMLDGIARFALAAISFAAFFLLVRYRFLQGGDALLRHNELLVEQERTSDALIREKLAHQISDEAHFVNRLMHGIVRIDHLIPLYERALRFALSTRKHRLTVVLGTVALFIATALLPITGIVKSEFFPASDEDLLFINVTAPIGMKLEKTDVIMQEIGSALQHYPEIKNFSIITGQASSQDGLGGGGGAASHTGSVVIKLSKPKERDITSYDLATKIRDELATIQGADITVASQQGGPPAGAAFEAQIRGEDLDQLSHIANDLKDVLATIPGVTGIDISLKEAPAEYTFALDSSRLKLYGLDAASVGSILRMAVSGTEITQVLRDNDEIKVIARFDERALPTLGSLQNLEIVNRSGVPVYLRDVATIELKPSVNAITRIDEKRVAKLSAGVVGDTNAQEVLKAFQDKVAADYALPDGYTLSYGGENEENAESVQSILRAMIIAAVLIVSTLVIQFNSFRKALLVLVTLPLALIGVFIGLALFGVPLSFPGLIGILALFGIVVKNAIILVDKININLRVGIPFEEAIVDAGKSRLEAIFITSFCTILGIIPITLSNALWQALGSAIIFGLMFSSFLTLFIIPVLYRMLASAREKADRV
jgi:HAE1 family hydrophobic/amphiphilic exporter-1